MSGSTSKTPGRRHPAAHPVHPMGSPKGNAEGTGLGGGGPGSDPCDLRYDVDLTGTTVAALAPIVLHDVLDVQLHVDREFETAVCRSRPAGDYVGSLANIEGLDQLLGCLRAGHRYEAEVADIERTRCRVIVGRVPA